MADILIRGMEMPRSCLDCPFVSYDSDICTLMDEDIPIYGAKPSWCPIVPLPEGHGKLIDGTDLYAVLDGGFDVDLDELPETKDAILQMIQSAETIVPAEGGAE